MLFGAYRSNVMTDTPLLQATSSKLKAQPLMSITPSNPRPPDAAGGTG